ncbi:hypothetical protein [Streptomyces sp. NPDC013455]|uniref:hypothetical protein n=1 Tax=Streptomyces sp. NPDC013455 TaxID=3155605 RepID=UPI0033E63D1A
MATTDERPVVRDVAGGVRDLLRGTGASADSKWVRGLKAAPQGNVLFAVALHAADRRAHGHTLTDLEQALLEVVGTVLTDDELRAAGTEYRATVTDLDGKVDLLPARITGLERTKGFSFADLDAFIPQMEEESKHLANVAVVDPAAIAAGHSPDSPAFQAAVTDCGFGTTLLAGPPPAPGASRSSEQDLTYRVRLEFDKFLCEREVGDGLSGRDEIYWTAATRSELETEKRIFQSEEFGDVEKGETHTFSSNNRVVFDGLAGDFVTSMITTWEADHSNSQWYDDLHTALQAFVDHTWFVEFIPGKIGKILEVVRSAIQLFVDLKEILRNHDDQSCLRGIVIDRNALVTLYMAKSREWSFNGDGHHILTIAYTGDRPKFPVGTIEYTTIGGGQRNPSWRLPVSTGWESSSPPALASLNGTLYCMYIRPDDNAVMWSTLTNGTWTPPTPIRNLYSLFAPALCVHKGKVYAAITNLDAYLGVISHNGTGDWTTWSQVSVFDASTDPLITSHNNGLVTGFRSGGLVWGASLWPSYDDGRTWEEPFVAPFLATELQPMSTASFDGAHLIAFRHTDGSARILSRTGTTPYQEINKWGWDLPDAPAITVHDGTVWMAIRSNDAGDILATRLVDGSFDSVDDFLAAGAMQGAVALASHDGVLYAMYRR